MSNEQDIELDLTSIAHGGEAIGRWQGKVVFVPAAIPGERVRVRLLEEKRNWARAQLLDVLTPSPDRVAPACADCGACGGCQWQHIAYGRQLDLRLEIVADQMRRLGHIADPPLDGIVPAPQAWHYRNNIQLHSRPSHAGTVPAAADGEGEEPPAALGFIATDGQSVVPVRACPLAHELIEDLIGSLDFGWAVPERVTVRAGINTGERLVLIESDMEESPDVSVDLPVSIAHLNGEGRLLTLVGNSFLHERLHERTYRVSAPSFFQVNTAQAENLLEVVQTYCALEGGERVLDVFCGVGTFSLPLAERAGEVVGVESSPWAVADALVNGEGLENIQFVEGDAAGVLPELEGQFQVIVVDPPRAGCGRGVIERMVALRPERLVYVSCDPATLARDTTCVTEGGFDLESLLALDMFPQTPHVETVALFRPRRR